MAMQIISQNDLHCHHFFIFSFNSQLKQCFNCERIYLSIQQGFFYQENSINKDTSRWLV